jgi:hypothetical protein
MSLDDRFELFGNPSESMAPEAVWRFVYNEERAPSFEEAVESLLVVGHCDRDEAERRMLDAIRDGEVLARIEDEDWRLSVDEATSAAITRRYMDRVMKRSKEMT